MPTIEGSVTPSANIVSTLFEELYSARHEHLNIFVKSRDRTITAQIGDPASFGTTGYWMIQFAILGSLITPASLRQGRTLLEETLACVLGGFGIPAEVGSIAFQSLRTLGLFDEARRASLAELEDALRRLRSPDGRTICYRFARQRAHRIHAVIAAFDEFPRMPERPIELRDWLRQLPGVGPKTASWVVRNWTGCDELAIVDIHLLRAGRRAGWFPREWSTERDYQALEEAYLKMCRLTDLDAGRLDTIIWDQMRTAGPAARY